MLLAAPAARCVGQGRQMAIAVTMAVGNTIGPMGLANRPFTGGTGPDFVAGENRVGFIRTAGPMSLAGQPAGTVRAAQMSGTLNLPVNSADGPMVEANVAFTRGTAN